MQRGAGCVVIRRGYSICNSADSIYLFHLFEAADYKIMLLEITWLFSIYKKRLANLDISFDYKQDRYVCSVFRAFENRLFSCFLHCLDMITM